MTINAFMRMYLRVAIACFTITVIAFVVLIYLIAEVRCTKAFDLKDIGAVIFVIIYFSTFFVAFFSLAVTKRGERQFRELAQSELGVFPIISYPIRIYFIHLALFIFCTLTLCPPLGACLAVSSALRECGLI